MLSTTCWQDQWSPLSQFSFHHFLVNTYLFKIISVSFILISLSFLVFSFGYNWLFQKWWLHRPPDDASTTFAFLARGYDHLTPAPRVHIMLDFLRSFEKKAAGRWRQVRSFHPNFWALSVNKPPRQAHQVLGSVH